MDASGFIQFIGLGLDITGAVYLSMGIRQNDRRRDAPSWGFQVGSEYPWRTIKIPWSSETSTRIQECKDRSSTFDFGVHITRHKSVFLGTNNDLGESLLLLV